MPHGPYGMRMAMCVRVCGGAAWGQKKIVFSKSKKSSFLKARSRRTKARESAAMPTYGQTATRLSKSMSNAIVKRGAWRVPVRFGERSEMQIVGSQHAARVAGRPQPFGGLRRPLCSTRAHAAHHRAALHAAAQCTVM